MNTGTIILKRNNQWANRIRKYKIILNNQKIGTISNDKEEFFEVKPGQHELFLKIDWTRSNKYQFTIKEGQTINLVCGCVLKGWKLFFVLIYIFLLFNSYLYIENK